MVGRRRVNFEEGQKRKGFWLKLAITGMAFIAAAVYFYKIPRPYETGLSFGVEHLSVVAIVLMLLAGVFFFHRQLNLTAHSLRLSRTDELTGVVNQQGFRLELESCFRAHDPDRGQWGVMLVDFDIEVYNADDFGPDDYQGMIQEFALRFSRIVRTRDTVARLSGSKFGFILFNNGCEEGFARITRELVIAKRETVLMLGRRVNASAFIGAYVVDGSERNTADVLNRAELALTYAKNRYPDKLEILTLGDPSSALQHKLHLVS
jgi:diguanylate cyclase (GGDEF)-like protein